MRIAHLILTDGNPEHLERLIKRLQHRNADFFIHVDLKTNITPFLDLENLGQVSFIRPRVKIYNNGYSMKCLQSSRSIRCSGYSTDSGW